MDFRSIKPVHTIELLAGSLCPYQLDTIPINTLWTCTDTVCKAKSTLLLRCMKTLEERRALSAGGPDLSATVLETGLSSTDLHRSPPREGHAGQNLPPPRVRQGRQVGSKAERCPCL